MDLYEPVCGNGHVNVGTSYPFMWYKGSVGSGRAGTRLENRLCRTRRVSQVER